MGDFNAAVNDTAKPFNTQARRILDYEQIVLKLLTQLFCSPYLDWNYQPLGQQAETLHFHTTLDWIRHLFSQSHTGDA